MQIKLNGQAVAASQSATLAQLLTQQTQLPEQFAIAVNGVFVPQANYPETALADGDEIELLVPMQGG